jgi:hypothetical protein
VLGRKEKTNVWKRPRLQTVGRVVGKEELLLPKSDYYLDESYPDIVSLCRQDGAFVAAFSAKGATGQGILEAAREDYRGLIETNAGFLNLQGEDENQKRSA